MEKIFSYIFGSLQRHDEAAVKIVKILKRQNTINKLFVVSTIAAGACLYFNESQRKGDMKKIEILTKEIEELKKMKGE